MSNFQCQWCQRSYNPYGDGVRHQEKLDFCSERCRHEARSSGWKSLTEKSMDKFSAAYQNNPPRIETDKERSRRIRNADFEKFWWNIAIPIIALVFTFFEIHSSDHFFHLIWPPTSAEKWIVFLFNMCLMFPVLYIGVTICLFPVIVIRELIWWVIENVVE